MRSPLFKGENSPGVGLVVLLGYAHGMAVWYLMPGQEARELYSTRTNHKCRTALILPTSLSQRAVSFMPEIFRFEKIYMMYPILSTIHFF